MSKIVNKVLDEKEILPLCRLNYGEIWEDKIKGHRVGVFDATKIRDVRKIMNCKKASLIINDPPYNINIRNSNFTKISLNQYLKFSFKWVFNSSSFLKKDSHLYIWMGLDYKDNFQLLPDFMIMMRDFEELKCRNFITVRNQRGYGTQKNWMWVRQELLHYTKGNPNFKVVYTDIPKILKGYYKVVNGKRTDNFERSKSKTIRPGNVWVDVQQVFYRMNENVPSCYAQKPLEAIERIILTSSDKNSLIADFFSHSGTTLIAGEKTNRKVYTFDINPIFAEITIRRLENYRQTGKTGWQQKNPFFEFQS